MVKNFFRKMRAYFLRHISGCGVLLLVAAFAPDALAAELTGFGPIQFGMSKADALAILGDRVKRDGGDYLVYEMPLGKQLRNLEVSQIFSNGLAGRAYISYEIHRESPEICLAKSMWIQGVMRKKYGKHVASRSEAPRNMLPGMSAVAIIEKSHLSFESGAFISLHTQFYWRPNSSCYIGIHYQPSEPDLLPF